MFYLIKRLFLYVEKFIYYGRAGTKCEYFDADSMDILIYAHIKKVRKFMDSDNTHLMWNNRNNKGLIRKLYEFEELCKRKCKNDLASHYHFSNVKGFNLSEYFKNPPTGKLKSQLFYASKKDQLISKSLRERYYHMLTHYVSYFWD